MIQYHYPERLGQGIWFVNAPRFFFGAWRVVSPFVAQSTRNRIHFCNTTDDLGPLLDLFGESNLPTYYGGTGRDTRVEEAAAVCSRWLAVEDSVDMPPGEVLLQHPDLEPPVVEEDLQV